MNQAEAVFGLKVQITLYIDGVAIIVQAETEDPTGNIIHPLESNYYEFTRYDPATGVTYGWWRITRL